MNATRFALRNRSVVLVLTGFAVLLGVLSLLTMPRREDPKITIRTGLVLARYPGAKDWLTLEVTESAAMAVRRIGPPGRSSTGGPSRDSALHPNGCGADGPPRSPWSSTS